MKKFTVAERMPALGDKVQLRSYGEVFYPDAYVLYNPFVSEKNEGLGLLFINPRTNSLTWRELFAETSYYLGEGS